MEVRSLFNKVFGGGKSLVQAQRMELLSDTNNTFYKWNGKIFESDIVRSAIRPKSSAVGKLNPKHIRGEGENMKINPDPLIKAILQRPNPYMSMQDFLMKMTFQREIHKNAFAFIQRDEYDRPIAVYPIPYSSVELLEAQGEVFVKFWFRVGKYMVVPYVDLIHLRKDFFNHDFFGESDSTVLTNPMEVINTSDQGIVKAIKNSSVVKWLLKYKTALRPEDIKANTKAFVDSYLSIDSGTSIGAAGVDTKADLEQVKPYDYVPNAMQMDKTIQRLWAYFGVNEKIVQNKFTEDEWNAFYEAEIEPIAQQLSNAFTWAFFSARERGHGNVIIFEAGSLQYASMATKLKLVDMVDRGALTPNEWRTVLNLGPIEGGDKPIRRLDTVPVSEGGKANASSSVGED